MLELLDVSKRFGQLVALKQLSMAFDHGSTTALIGPSGCGKSTLLRLIVGLVASDTGSIRFGNELLSAGNITNIRRSLGYVIQEGGLFPHLSVRGNITLMARHLKWDRHRIAAQLENLLSLTRLPAEILDRYPTQISGGQRQRVSLMRALFLDPDVILLDEPLGALDPLIRSELQHDLRKIFAAVHKTVILVTHDIGEAAFLAEDLVLLKEGQVVQRGTLEQLVQAPEDEFVTRFVNAQRSPLESLQGEAP